MSDSVTDNTIKDDCISKLEQLSKNISSTQRIRDSFSKFPNGFLINDSINANRFFENTIKEPTRKDKLSQFISSIKVIKKLGTSSFEIAIPSTFIEKNNKIDAIKLINEAIILWTKNFVYKIPTSEKALKRFEKTKDNLNTISSLDPKLQKYFLIPQCINTDTITIQYSEKCKTLSLDSNSITLIDNFLHSYFTRIFDIATSDKTLLRGFQHGDLHFRNLLQTKEDTLLITDLDLIKLNGFPFLDLMHFAIHLIRTTERTSQYEPLELFLSDKSYLYGKLLSLNFYKLSELWLKHYNDEYIPLYIHSQIEWYHYNKVVSDELSQLEKLIVLYNL